MPTLTGTIADVTGTPIPPSDVAQVVVKAPAPRVAGGNPSQVITTTTIPVTVGENGVLSVTLDPGVAVLVIRTFRSHDTFELRVTADMTTIREAIIETLGQLPELEQSQLVALAAQVRADAAQVSADKGVTTAARNGASAARDEAVASAAAALVSEGKAKASETNAAGSASAADAAKASAESARSDAQTQASNAASSASAAGSAQTAAEAARDSAAMSATNAAGSATDSESSRTGAAQIREDLLALLEDTEAWAGFQEALTELEPRMAAKIDELKGGAPAAFDTLGEVAAWIADSEDASAAMLQSISERAKKTYVDEQLSGKAPAGAENTAQWGQVSGKPTSFPSSWSEVSGKPSTFPAAAHTHPVGEIATASGTASSTTYLRGDGTWNTPTNTTYLSMNQATADAGTSATGNVIPAKVLRDTIGKAAVVNATYGTTATLWFGTQAQYDALAAATKNASGFVAVITS